MKIVGRKEEQKILEKFFQENEARFLAIYGRRRVGKTFLIERFFENKNCIFFQVTGIKNGNLNRQISEFVKAVSTVFYNGTALQEPKDWFEAFEILTEAINKTSKRKKVVLFFDELPWMATRKSKILQALEYYWNRFWHSNDRLRLIVCGSAASWIINKLIRNTGGLYNRITDRIRLEPFSLSETVEFLESRFCKFNKEQILKLYMVLGGIPLYLSRVRKELSADQNIDGLCFNKDGYLFGEFRELFAALFDDESVYLNIVKLIASHSYGVAKTELGQKLNITDGGSLTKWLQELEDCGFINSFIPYTNINRGHYYKIADEYSAFYCRWIEPNKNSILKLKNQSGYWLEKSKSPAYRAWSGIAFEAICFKHVQEIRQALNLSANSLPYGWRHQSKSREEVGIQIDLLFDRGDDAVTICEIKYSDKPFSIDKEYCDKLKRKIDIFSKKTKINKQIFLAIIATNGLKPNSYSDEIISSVVKLEDLMKC